MSSSMAASQPHSLQHLRTVVEQLWANPETDHCLTQSLFRWNEESAEWQVFEDEAEPRTGRVRAKQVQRDCR